MCVLTLSVAHMLQLASCHRPHYLSEVHVENIKPGILSQSTVKLHMSPEVFTSNPTVVSISYSGLNNEQYDNWLGLYSPAKFTSFDQTAPTQYVKLKGLPSSGQINMTLVNTGSDFSCAVFGGGRESPILLATSNRVTNSLATLPTGVHVGLTQVSNELLVTWRSMTSTSAHAKVLYGSKPGEYTASAVAVASAYGVQDMCGAPASTVGWRDLGTIWNATLSNLQSGTRYYYIVGDEENGFSDEFSVLGPLAADAHELTFLAYGDMGVAAASPSEEWDGQQRAALNTSKRIREHVFQQGDIDMINHIGDISYARGYAADWTLFMQEIEPFASRVPYQTGIGNHERDSPHSGSVFNGTDSGGECGVPYLSLFKMANTYSSGAKQAYYSFDYGPVHFLQISTEDYYRADSQQFEFITQDLKSVDRTRTPWVIVTGHRPFYLDSSWPGDQTNAVAFRAALEELFLSTHVDVVLTGHHHSSQRTCQVYKGTCTKGAPIYLVIGMAGYELSTDLTPTKPPFMDYVSAAFHGYTRFYTNETHLHYQLRDNAQDQVRDEFWLRK
jgi:acid phosphatase type 7